MWHAPCSHEMGGRCAAGTGVVRGEYAVAKDDTRGGPPESTVPGYGAESTELLGGV